MLAVRLSPALSTSRYLDRERLSKLLRPAQGSSRMPEGVLEGCGCFLSRYLGIPVPWALTAHVLDWQVGSGGRQCPLTPPGQSSRMPPPDPSEIDLVPSSQSISPVYLYSATGLHRLSRYRTSLPCVSPLPFSLECRPHGSLAVSLLLPFFIPVLFYYLFLLNTC